MTPDMYLLQGEVAYRHGRLLAEAEHRRLLKVARRHTSESGDAAVRRSLRSRLVTT